MNFSFPNGQSLLAGKPPGRSRPRGHRSLFAVRDALRRRFIPQGFNARTRVHEYGGGAYFVHDDTIFFSNFKDQRLYRQDPGATATRSRPSRRQPASLRYADGRVTPDGKTDRLRSRTTRAGARSDQRDRRRCRPMVRSEPQDHSVAVTTSIRFLASVVTARRLAWTCWRHPQMPWDGTELWVGRSAVRTDRFPIRRRVAGSATESDLSAGMGARWIALLHFRSDGLVESLRGARSGKIDPILEIDGEIGVPQWLFGYYAVRLLSNGRVACIVNKNGFEHVIAVRCTFENSPRLSISVFRLRRAFDPMATTHLFFAGASASKAAEVVVSELEQ